MSDSLSAAPAPTAAVPTPSPRAQAFEAFRTLIKKEEEAAQRRVDQSKDGGFVDQGHEAARGVQERRLLTLDAIRDQAIKTREAIAAGALITLGNTVDVEGEKGERKNIYLIPNGEGRKIKVQGTEHACVSVISPLGRELVGKEEGDVVVTQLGTRGQIAEFEIIEIL